MTDWLVFMLNALGGNSLFGGKEPGDGNVGRLSLSLEGFNGDLWRAVVDIHNFAVKPVTAAVLAVLCVSLLARQSTQIDGDRELGVKVIFATLLKVALVFLVVTNALPILQAVLSIATDITARIIQNPNSPATMFGDQARDKIAGMNPLEQVGALVMLFLPFIVAVVAAVVPLALIIFRFVQLAIMFAFASLPLAFLADSETKQIAIGFLKAFAATALSGVVIVLVLKIYGALNFVGVNQFNGNVIGFIAGNFGNLLLGPVVLLMGLFTANAMAKKLVGDG